MRNVFPFSLLSDELKTEAALVRSRLGGSFGARRG
jgi:hypothetical protein